MLKVLELFAGIGACSKALERLGIEHEIVDAVEIDKFAIKSFNAIHNTNFEPQDITKWDKDIECDLIMHGSPCQDFSIAGKQAGGDEGSGTRSSLMYETLRIVEKLRPKYVIWENVKNILSRRHIHNFEEYLKEMDKLNYFSFFKVLNAKDYGIPQNRERVFTLSIRKDIAIEMFQWNLFFIDSDNIFPKPIKLEKRLKDVMENNVEEKYYLSKEKLDMISKWKCYEKPLEHIMSNQSIARTITTRVGADCGGMKLLAIKTANKQGYDLATNGDGVDLVYPSSTTRRGRVGHGVSKTITATPSQGVVDNYKIRKLTPKECFRLMGFDDEDYEKASKVCSESQLYKQAGNSIVVNVLEQILSNVLE